jgi:hypothetical protein
MSVGAAVEQRAARVPLACIERLHARSVADGGGGSMSKPARTTTPGIKVQPPPLPQRDEDGRVSGARRALNYAAYDGLVQLGSDAFSTPLPPSKSERPRFAAPRLHAGWYMISAAAGFSVGAVVLAIAFKPALTPERPPVSLGQTTGYLGPWVMVSNNKPVQMREVLEPVPPAATPKPIGSAPIAIEPVPMAEVAEVAVPPSAAAPQAAASAAVIDETPQAPVTAVVAATSTPAAVTEARQGENDDTHARTSSRSHQHSRHDAPVAQLSRAQVVAAMHHVEPEVSACFRGTSGSVMADVTIVGRTGHVTTAHVNGQNGAIGSCIARAVRHASFPTFKAETLTIRYPFAH